MAKTKIVEYTDGDGITRLAEIPIDAPASDGPLGIPLGIDLDGLPYEKSFIIRLYKELWTAGLRTPEDFSRTDALQIIRQRIQAILKMDANSIRQHILEANNVTSKHRDSR